MHPFTSFYIQSQLVLFCFFTYQLKGDFANDVFEGKGVYKWANGSKYDGSWTDNK